MSIEISLTVSDEDLAFLESIPECDDQTGIIGHIIEMCRLKKGDES